MRLLILTLLVLVGASMLTALAMEKPGFVLLAYGQTSIELALFDFMIALVVLFIAFYLLIRFLVRLVVMPARLNRRYQRHQIEKAHRLFYRGLLELSEGRWTRAERLLLRSVWNHDTPVLGYLGAARAAQMQAAYDRRDDYLKRAIESDRSADVAVGLLQAELQLSSDQNEQALATLQHLNELSPRHDYVLYMLGRLHRSREDWDGLMALMPALRKARAIPTAKVDEVEVQAVSEQMLQALRDQDEQAVQRLWKQLPRRQRQNPRLLEVHVRALDGLGQDEQAVSALRKYLKTDWDTGLVRLLGELDMKDPLQVLGRAETWLQAHGEDADLLLTLGRLSLKAELWGKARLYLEGSLNARPEVLTYRLLGDLLDRLGEQEQARACYQQGLALAVEGSAPPLRLPRPAAPAAPQEVTPALPPKAPQDIVRA